MKESSISSSFFPILSQTHSNLWSPFMFFDYFQCTILSHFTHPQSLWHSLSLLPSWNTFFSFTSRTPHTLFWFCCYMHLFCWILFLFSTSKIWSIPQSVFRTLLCLYSFLHSFHSVPRHWIPSIYSFIFQLWNFPALHIYFFIWYFHKDFW